MVLLVFGECHSREAKLPITALWRLVSRFVSSNPARADPAINSGERGLEILAKTNPRADSTNGKMTLNIC